MSCFIIAEIGVNHGGSITLAKEHIDAAAQAGADAVKFQTFNANELVSLAAPKAEYQKRTTDRQESQLEMLRSLELGHQQFIELEAYSSRVGIEFMSSPFDISSLHFLISHNLVSRIKIPSGEIVNVPLLVEIGKAKLPCILSTGMSTLADIELALGALYYGYIMTDSSEPPSLKAFSNAYMAINRDSDFSVTLLHCTTEYPALPATVNLRVLGTLRSAFNLDIGFSDHTDGIHVPIAAVALGACVIEKHFTLDRKMKGPDHLASLEPSAFKEMVRSIRDIEVALGDSRKIPGAVEMQNMKVARRSLVSKKEIQAGELFSAENLTIKRPGNGISAVHFFDAIGRPAPQHFDADELVVL